MYRYIEGNIFESPAQTLVNTVNTVGAMGKGLAKEFKRLFPDMFAKYQKLCEAGKLRIGRLWLYSTPNKCVLNFPTKKHWRQPSQLKYVEMGLQAFTSGYYRARIHSIAFPRLGCGNGELDWKDVKPLMEQYLKKLPIDVYVYVVDNYIIPEHRKIKEIRRWLISEPKTYPFDEFKRDVKLALSKSQSAKKGKDVRYEVTEDNGFIKIIIDGSTAIVPWHGDETGKGMRELWQFIRDRGICSVKDLIALGFPQPDIIIEILLRLPYCKTLNIQGEGYTPAIHLMPQEKDFDLFFGEEESYQSIRL